MYKTLELGLHLKSARHLVQKMLPTETFIVRNEGDLMRNSHLYLKARKIKWPSSGKAQSLQPVEGCNPDGFGRISSLTGVEYGPQASKDQIFC